MSIGATHQATRKATLIWRVHEHRLNTLDDGWYSSRFIRRADATSPRLGSETDVLFAYTISEHMTARVGYFRLFPGAYLTGTGTHGAPYEVRFQLYGSF